MYKTREIKDKYGDERRTSIDMTAIEYIEDESLIPEENIIIALTKNGYIKRTTSDTFKVQRRGGVGIKGMATNEEDFVDHIINLSKENIKTFTCLYYYKYLRFYRKCKERSN